MIRCGFKAGAKDLFCFLCAEDGIFTSPSWVRIMRDVSRFDVNSEFACWYDQPSKPRGCEIWDKTGSLLLYWARSG